ncbi:7-methylguanosine phosphate-specific 5'-nucleotidase [Glycine max]|nr:7-methylguanosine phosphate-specific 5'-nucleotidase [Glycine max]
MSHRLQLQGIIVTSFRQPHFSFFSRYTSTTTSCGKNLEMEEVKGASDLLVGDPALLEKKIDAIRLGDSCYRVIADFDATLTMFWVNGTRGQTSHGLLQQGNPDYNAKRQQLYEYYHPLEFSPNIGLEEKTKLMEEWWGKAHGLLVEGGLTYDSIRQSVANANIAFREGVCELFEFLEERDAPVLIFSAGLADIIEEVLRQKLHRSFKNVRIVSNRMVFDDDGRLAICEERPAKVGAIGFNGVFIWKNFALLPVCPSAIGKLIHSLNKNEHALDMAAPVHERLGDMDEENQCFLLGDHTGDLGMSDGLNYEPCQISVLLITWVTCN